MFREHTHASFSVRATKLHKESERKKRKGGKKKKHFLQFKCSKAKENASTKKKKKEEITVAKATKVWPPASVFRKVVYDCAERISESRHQGHIGPLEHSFSFMYLFFFFYKAKFVPAEHTLAPVYRHRCVTEVSACLTANVLSGKSTPRVLLTLQWM